MKVSRDIYATLIYNSAKDYKWVIHRKYIKNFPVTFQDVEVAHKVWVNNIAALKVNTIDVGARGAVFI